MELLDAHLRQRRLTLWVAITKLYEVEDSVDIQVRKWIHEGTFDDHICSLKYKGIIWNTSAKAVPHDDTQVAPHCS